MKSLRLRIGIMVALATIMVVAIVFLQTKNYLKIPLTSKEKINIDKIVPLGMTNPFSYPDIDISGGECLKNKSVLMPSSQTGRSYSEAHMEKTDLKKCLPVAVSYMNNIKDIGVNVISQHFTRRYDENGTPYFGVEEKEHINHEVAIQLYVGEFGNYFWAAVNPVSSKGFIGDINIETHRIIAKNETSKKYTYLPASEAGFAEWQKWLNASLDYLKDHGALGKLLYFQIGNESDDDYAKTDKPKRDDKNDFYWSAYAKLAEKSYDIIKSKSPKTKIVIGANAAGSVMIDGFQRPVLEYLTGKINENGNIADGNKKCGGTGCFDVYDYHTFSGYKEYKGGTACQPRSCVGAILTIEKTPENMNKLLSDNNFSDKKLVVQQGGTYTGQDSKVDVIKEYQSEEDQASYLIKNSVYLLANGVEQNQFITYIENFCYKGALHNWFTMMGLSYNGIPKIGSKDCKGEKNAKFNKENCDGQSPCPDPGNGVKKLSYFAEKKLIEILKNVNLNKIKKIPSETDNVYIFKTIKNNGKANYFAWWDWWNACPRPDKDKERMDTACINDNKPSLVINVGKNIAKVKATEIVPNQNTGEVADKMNYEDIFVSYYEDVKKDGGVAIKLGTKPIYIETDT